MRLFIALDVSEEVRARVAEAVTRERATVDAKWARTEGLHITVVFFGELKPEKLEEIVATTRRIARDHASLKLQIKGAGVFGGNAPRVLWLGIGGAVDRLPLDTHDHLMKPATSRAIPFILLTVLIDSIGFGIIIPALPRLLIEVGQLTLAGATRVGGWLALTSK